MLVTDRAANIFGPLCETRDDHVLDIIYESAGRLQGLVWVRAKIDTT